jgi:hypothetical protein
MRFDDPAGDGFFTVGGGNEDFLLRIERTAEPAEVGRSSEQITNKEV